MEIKIIFIALFLFLFGCHNQKTSTKIEESTEDSSYGQNWFISRTNEWLVKEGLINVESILYDAENQVFYVSNGIGYGLGTAGFISKFSKEGNLQELKWIKNLNRPTGMATHDSLLYVADVNSLVVINKGSGKIVDKYIEPISNSGLNDVAVNEEGEVYVSASFIHSIFKLKDGQLIMWARDEEKLKWANGLIADNKQILVAGLSLSRINTKSKKISLIDLNLPIKDFDGITSDGEGGYFLTTVENSGLFHISEQKSVTKLKEDTIYFGDLEFNPEQKHLYVPRGNKKRGEFFITVFKMDKISSNNTK